MVAFAQLTNENLAYVSLIHVRLIMAPIWQPLLRKFIVLQSIHLICLIGDMINEAQYKVTKILYQTWIGVPFDSRSLRIRL